MSWFLLLVCCFFWNLRFFVILNVNIKWVGLKVWWKIKNIVLGKGNEKES